MFHGNIIMERKNNFRLYIPFGGNIELLAKSVESVIMRIRQYTNTTIPIVIINNTLIPIPEDFPNKNSIIELIPPVELVHAQELNWIIKESMEHGEDFCLTLHTDAELLDGALEDILEKIEESKNERWAWILAYGSGVFSAINWRFFYQENVDFDPFLFPFYYMDNHMYQIMRSRDWKVLETKRCAEGLVKHVSSHRLKEDSVFSTKNNLAFPLQGDLYTKIWGGLPGKETKLDPTASGTLRVK